MLVITNLFASYIFKPLPTQLEYNEKKVSLGKKLFFDPTLSLNKDVSCASCHSVYGADNVQFSFGTNKKEGFINTPSLFNAQFNLSMFWNGRSKDYTEQLLDGPLFNEHEMANNKDIIMNRLNQSDTYKSLFFDAYKKEPTFENMLNAIVEFEKTLISINSKFDKYLRNEIKLTKDEEEGMELFTSYGCASCHNGINVGGNSYQKFGTVIPYENDGIKKWDDRFKVTKDETDKNVFRVPSLRNVEKTAPYFHSGEVSTLKNAINVMAYHNLGILLEDEEINKIEAFLKTLTGEIPKTWTND